MGALSGRARAAGISAMVVGLAGSGLVGAGAFAVDGAKAGTDCPDGGFLYRPPSATAGAATRYSTTTGSRTETVTTVIGPPTGSAEAQTDPFVATGDPDPDSFICIREGQMLPSITRGGATPPVGVPVEAPSSTPAADPVAATPAPTPDPMVPAPGMIDLPGDTPTPTPSTGAPSNPSPSDFSSDPGPADTGGQGGTAVLPGPVDDATDLSGAITRDQVIARAVSWVLQAVPYSQTSWWTDSHGAYRQDCSGYVSMAWGLNQRSNYWTGNLATVSHRIASKSLKMGDILLLPRSHVVIFAGWANAERTKFHLFEEYSRGKPARYLTGADLGYYLDRGYGAYRYDRIADVAPGKAGSQSTVYVKSDVEPAATPTPAPTPNADLAEQELADSSVMLEDLQTVAWSRSLADEANAEEFAPSASIGAMTPESVPELPLQTLVEAQVATDQRADAIPTGSGAATVLLAAGLGLLFLTFPLTVAARAGVWTRHYASAEES